ncbi:MAG: DUF3656 domain-containing protein [Bacilli bacterium]|nr:DUF3656 domain-containing protein [Bacilli bacterium]
MSELLSPAGNLESFYLAINNGADALYLGLDKFSARAYASNFTIESLKDLVKYAHLRNTKIYVAINTIIYDHELPEVYKTIDELAAIFVDGIIAQDLAVINYITNTYRSIYAHASTQLGIDDVFGASITKEMGVNRIVFARETPLEDIKDIKEKLGIEVEAFIHGALCVSYSGNCFMSSAIGERSGNRGRCAGCCRKLYTLEDIVTKEEIKTGYLLSMKDLNVSRNIKDFSFVDSLKIEGRMKEPTYVGKVTKYYRDILDHKKVDFETLDKVFNRTYTKGYILGEDKMDITNIERPNNFGYLIGKVERAFKNKVMIRLSSPLNKGDQIRIETNDPREEISIAVTRLLDSSFNVVESAKRLCVVDCPKWVEIGANVYKTKDSEFYSRSEKELAEAQKKLEIDVRLIAKLGEPLSLRLRYKGHEVTATSSYIVSKASKKAATKESLVSQLDRMGDTPYKLGNVSVLLDEDVFVPLSSLNDLRREAVDKLNEARLDNEVIYNESPLRIIPEKHEEMTPEITVEVNNEKQFEVARSLGIKHIYFKNRFRRNHVSFKETEGEVLVGGLNGLSFFRGKNDIVTDASLNVTNHKSVAILSSLGAKRITLSEEINKPSIVKLIEEYKKEYGTHPNLELIVYGRSKIMHTMYCPLKRLGMCPKCKTSSFALKDEYASFPLMFNDDCTISLLNSKVTNIMDNLEDLKGINYYRLAFTTETEEEVRSIIESFQEKLDGSDERLFNEETDTRGHFFKNPL